MKNKRKASKRTRAMKMAMTMAVLGSTVGVNIDAALAQTTVEGPDLVCGDCEIIGPIDGPGMPLENRFQLVQIIEGIQGKIETVLPAVQDKAGNMPEAIQGKHVKLMDAIQQKIDFQLDALQQKMIGDYRG